MKDVAVHDAVGTVIAHDMTQIIPGQYKGPKFRKGHIVTEADIPVLLSMGKQRVYVMEKDEGDVHENEAAARISKAAAGLGITLTEPEEGKIELIAGCDGLLKINRDLLMELVEEDQLMFATIHSDQLVKKGRKVAGTRVIPLFVPEDVVAKAEEVLKKDTLVKVLPLKALKVGVVTTGSEIYNGIIEDKFGPVLVKKFENFGSIVIAQVFADDDERMIADSIQKVIDSGAEMVCVTGGMSVDPDDRTPLGIRIAGGAVESYGAPVLPGAMFLLSYIGEIPVVGLPGCVMYSKITIFDLILPRLLAGERLTKKDIKTLAHGGLCRSCKECTYPNCGYGKA